MTLKEASIGRNNNLNIIRFIAAMLVLYMHSFALSLGNNSGDVIGIITMGKEYAGGLAVDIFFIISGFLICRSFDRTSSVKKYIIARFLRIWPLLFVTTVITVFIVGPAFSTFKIQDYFYFWQHLLLYMKNVLFISSFSRLPGLFMNHHNFSVNGSLWTLSYEVICYIFVALFAFIWKKRRTGAVIIASLLGVAHLLLSYIDSVNGLFSPSVLGIASNFARLGMYFAVGMVFYLYSDKVVISYKLFLFGLVVVILGILFFDFAIAFAIGGSCMIFYLGFQKHCIAAWYDKIGDLSYGVYIMAFPVQQAVICKMGVAGEDMILSMNPYMNMLVSTIVVLPLAYLSWHFIEQPILKLKDRIN